MPVDPNVDIVDKQRANRRGFLTGITLAELMMITLFVLLLLLGNYQRVEDSFGGREQLTKAIEMAEEMDKVIAASGSERPLSDTWRVLTRKVQAFLSRPEQFDRWLEQLELDPIPEIAQGQGEGEALRAEIGKLRDELAKTKTKLKEEQDRTTALKQNLSTERNNLTENKKRMDLLKVELTKTKVGGLVLCTYEPPGTNATELRGRSIPLGTVYLEADGVTLIKRNETLPNMQVVDYVGDAYDMGDALTLLGDWPIHRKLDFDEFANIGRRFVSLGNRESDKRQQCRFSMKYYIEDKVTPHSVFTEKFLKYFFRQSDVTNAEFEILRSEREN